MLVYNVTVKVNTDIHEEWLEWMKKTHIPEVLATGYFSNAPALQKKTLDRYSNQFVAFRTVLQVIEEIFPTHTKS